MIRFQNIVLFTAIIIGALQAEVIEQPMVVIIPSYNNERWHKANLASVLNQNYSNYRIIYINDSSKDKTAKYVENMVKKFVKDYRVIHFDTLHEDIPTSTNAFIELVNQKKRFFTLVNNYRRQGALANLYRAIYSCEDHEIMVLVDGDDWLFHNDVLKEINELYNAGDIWITHGKFVEYPKGGDGVESPFT